MLKFIHFIKNNSHKLSFQLVYGLVTAILFSGFIYLENYGFTIKILNTLFGLFALALLLYIPKRAVLSAGFFIGLFWFYWIGYSFQYTGVGYLTPFVTLGFAIIYMLFFGILALTKKVWLRAIFLFALSFFEPFDFNWMQIELLFVDSYIGIFKYQLIFTLAALTIPAYIDKKYRYTPLLLLIAALNYSYPPQHDAPLKIKLVQTNIKQEEKWLPRNLKPTVLMVYNKIHKAINEKYDVILLPESVIPLYLNENPTIIDSLSDFSYDITIVLGTLLYENDKSYNVTYMFHNGEYKIAKKMILVPFGEYVPLPKFAQKWVNDTFFEGEADFTHANKPTDFIIDDVKFRNAICYEATCGELFEGDVKYILAMSNNAWFTPSIEPTLQKLLMRFYARKNGVTIYHSANWSGTCVIK